MNNGKDKIIEFANKKKIFRAREVKEHLGISRVCIRRLVEEGELVKIECGLYSVAGNNFAESQSLIEVAAKVPKAVVCLLSALQFHELTTQNPCEVWISLNRETHIPKFESVMTKVFRLLFKR